MKLFATTFAFCLGILPALGQWHNKKCAVVLTYDDALNIHLDKVIPALDSQNLKGTFFLIGSSPAFTKRLPEWKKAAANHHELANHSIFHPCKGNLPGRSWVPYDYDLTRYTVKRLVDEVRMTNVLLEALDGKKERTYAYPCGDLTIGDTLFIDSLKKDFVAARGVKSDMIPASGTDLYNVGSFMIDGQTGDQLIEMVKKAMSSHSMIIFLFHGVGGEHPINVSLEAHSKLLHYLKTHEKEIWVTTFLEGMKELRRR